MGGLIVMNLLPLTAYADVATGYNALIDLAKKYGVLSTASISGGQNARIVINMDAFSPEQADAFVVEAQKILDSNSLRYEVA